MVRKSACPEKAGKIRKTLLDLEKHIKIYFY